MADAKESLVRIKVRMQHTYVAVLDFAHFTDLEVMKSLLFVQTGASWASPCFRCKKHRVNWFVNIKRASNIFMPEPVTFLAEVSIATFAAIAEIAIFRNEILVECNVCPIRKWLTFAICDRSFVCSEFYSFRPSLGFLVFCQAFGKLIKRGVLVRILFWFHFIYLIRPIYHH